MKLIVRVPLLIGLLVLATSLSIGAVVVLISSRALLDAARQALSVEARLNAEIVNLNLQSRLAILEELANRARTRTMDWPLIQESLRPDVARLDWLDVGLVTPDGNARYVTENSTADISDRDYFRSAIQGRSAISDVIISRITGKPVVMFAVPVWDSDDSTRRTIGALVGRIDGTLLSDIVRLIRANNPNAYSFLVSSQGSIIGHHDASLVTSQFNPIQAAKSDPSQQSLADMLTRALRQKSGVDRYVFQKKAVETAYVPMSNLPWLLFVSEDNEVFTRPLRQIWALVISIGAFFVLAGLGIAIAIGLNIIRPIKNVVATLRDISEGEGDLTQHLDITREDEIGEMGRYFNLTIEKIRDLIVMIKFKTQNLQGISVQMAKHMDETESSLSDISGNIESMQSLLDNQARFVSETSATMGNITENIGNLNGQVSEQSQNVSRSSTAVEEMIANINSVTETLARNSSDMKTLLEDSGVGREGLQGVADDIREIARQSDGLLEINEVMENIASQTNLLSMNAAIEAAHAGEAGKGFAVVADEIRKLADSASEQAKTTASVLKTIKDSIDKITDNTHAVLDKFEAIDEGVKVVSLQTDNVQAAMEQQRSGSREILEVIGRLNETTNMVKTGSEEMLAGSRLIVTESASLGKATEEITNGMARMVQSAGQITEAVEGVEEISIQNRENIDNLVKAVFRFRVDPFPNQIEQLREDMAASLPQL